MAKISAGLSKGNYIGSTKKKTSIGSSNRSRPLNKHRRRQWKAYRGQGR